MSRVARRLAAEPEGAARKMTSTTPPRSARDNLFGPPGCQQIPPPALRGDARGRNARVARGRQGALEDLGNAKHRDIVGLARRFHSAIQHHLAVEACG